MVGVEQSSGEYRAVSEEDRLRWATGDDYEVLASLGAGQYGSVWRVRDLSLERGAKLNGGAIKVSSAADRGAGILATGIPARAQIDGPVFEAFMTDMLQWRKVRMIGSAAAALAYVACGRADFYRESGAMLWDVAGGCALVLAAGGRVRMEGPALDQPLTVAASNTALATYLQG